MFFFFFSLCQAPLPSAFANTSAVSPFGSLGSAKPAAKEEDASKKSNATSSSAFASSSMAAFAGSEQSPFGSIGSSTTSVFKKSPTTEPEKPKTGFAAAAGPSPFATTAPSGFASTGSGFAGFGGGFGSAATKTGGLTSFASPGGPSSLNSTSQAKPFGAEGEENEDEEEADTGPGEFEQDKTDERFFERESMFLPSPFVCLSALTCNSRNWRGRREDVFLLQSETLPILQHGMA